MSYSREEYQRRVIAKICVNCGTKPAGFLMTKCEKCAASQRKSSRKQRSEARMSKIIRQRHLVLQPKKKAA